jgi:alpha-1,6-mannosyltransferase
MTFPGAVPRTFIGALVLVGLSKPVIWINDAFDRQFIG